jgi:hypothetical protein
VLAPIEQTGAAAADEAATARAPISASRQLSSERQLSPVADMPPHWPWAEMGQFQTHAPQQIASLFDHPVGASNERKGKGDAKGLSCLEVDKQFDFSDLLDW